MKDQEDQVKDQEDQVEDLADKALAERDLGGKAATFVSNKSKPGLRQNENSDTRVGRRYNEDEGYQNYGRQGKMGQEEPDSKGYKGVFFFEEEGGNDSKQLINRRGIHISGPYDDDDDDDDDGDDNIEMKSDVFYTDNDDYDPENSRRRNSRL